MHALNILRWIIILYERISLGLFVTEFVSSVHQLANMFAKPLPKIVMLEFFPTWPPLLAKTQHDRKYS